MLGYEVTLEVLGKGKDSGNSVGVPHQLQNAFLLTSTQKNKQL